MGRAATRRKRSKATTRKPAEKVADPRPRKRKPGPGQPELVFDRARLEVLAAIGCTYEEIARAFRVGLRTVERRAVEDPEFAEVIEGGRADGRRSLRRVLFGLALKANDENPPLGAYQTALYLSKQRFSHGGLEMSDRTDHSVVLPQLDLDTKRRDLAAKLSALAENKRANRKRRRSP